MMLCLCQLRFFVVYFCIIHQSHLTLSLSFLLVPYRYFYHRAVKPYAALMSSFEEVILMDADACFLRAPELLFDHPEYLRTGSLFFHDRILPGPKKGSVHWALSFLPDPSPPSPFAPRGASSSFVSSPSLLAHSSLSEDADEAFGIGGGRDLASTGTGGGGGRDRGRGDLEPGVLYRSGSNGPMQEEEAGAGAGGSEASDGGGGGGWVPENDASWFLRRRSKNQQEAAVVVLDKRRALFGLLGSCLLNDHQHRDYTWTKVYGDKETFWLGMAMAGLPYGFNPHFVGKVGATNARRSFVCGSPLLHVGADGLPFWLNRAFRDDGLSRQIKIDRPLGILEAYALDNGKGKWFRYGKFFDCLYPYHKSGEVTSLPADTREYIEGLTAVWEGAIKGFADLGGVLPRRRAPPLLDQLQRVWFFIAQSYCYLFRRCVRTV
jgi:hypothetical protein